MPLDKCLPVWKFAKYLEILISSYQQSRANSIRSTHQIKCHQSQQHIWAPQRIHLISCSRELWYKMYVTYSFARHNLSGININSTKVRGAGYISLVNTMRNWISKISRSALLCPSGLRIPLVLNGIIRFNFLGLHKFPGCVDVVSYSKSWKAELMLLINRDLCGLRYACHATDFIKSHPC